MSLIRNQKLSFWKAVEYSIRPTSLRMGDNVLSSDDVSRVANAYVLWALVIQDLLGDARTNSDKSMATWVKFLMTQDVIDVIGTCKQLLTCIRNWSPFMGDQGLSSFKRYLVANSITPGDHILSPLWSTIYSFSTTFDKFREINSCLSFVSRLTLFDVTWIENEAMAHYISFEQGLKTQTYDEDIIASLHELFLSKVKHFHLGLSRPKHGNGATSELPRGVGIAEKFHSFTNTYYTYQLSLMTAWSHPLIADSIIADADQNAQILFVPKGIDKKRVISTEPVANQYYQHLIFSCFDRMFCEDSSWNIDLHDQNYNRDLALLGSGHGDYATIDLSDASDSVTKTLVKGIMAHTLPYSLMERCRSHSAFLPNGVVIPLEKYAPMGSAVCFPLECIIFSLIVQLASKNVGQHVYFRVYGDDIIVPSSIYPEVIRLLSILHFNINCDKTFPPHSVFTESCGIECYNGIDVSPIRIPRRYDSLYYHNSKASPGRVYGVISFANSLYDFGCFNTRSYLISSLLEYFPEVPFSCNKERGLFSPTPTNFHLKSRWNSQLQRKEYRCWGLMVEIEDVDDFDRLVLMLEKYDTTTRTSLVYPSDLVELMVGSSHLRMKMRWRSQWDIDSIEVDLPKE